MRPAQSKECRTRCPGKKSHEYRSGTDCRGQQDIAQIGQGRIADDRIGDEGRIEDVHAQPQQTGIGLRVNPAHSSQDHANGHHYEDRRDDADEIEAMDEDAVLGREPAPAGRERR